MNLTQMKTKLRAILAGVADAETDASLDDLLQGAYQFTIPDLVTGSLFDGEWALSTVAGTEEYSFPSTVHSVKLEPPMLNDQWFLTIDSEPSRFWTIEHRANTTQARPYACLVYGRKVILRRIPDAVYTVKFLTRNYPAALGASEDLANRTHALAVVFGAALEFAADMGLDETARDVSARFDAHMKLLRRQSLTYPRVRRAMRSF